MTEYAAPPVPTGPTSPPPDPSRGPVPPAGLPPTLPQGWAPAPTEGWPPPRPTWVDSPAGAGYSELARNAAYRWWRPLAGTGLLFGVLFALLIAVTIPFALLGMDFEERTGPWSPLADLWEAAYLLAVLAMLIPAVLIAARVAQRRRVGTVSSVTGRLRVGWLAWCALLGLGATAVQLGLLFLLDVLAGPAGADPEVRWPGAGAMALSALVLVLLVPLQAAGEEYLARGWFVQAVGSWVRSPWPGILVGGALWTAMHAPSTVWGVADLVLFSVVLGWLTVRTGGLEAAIALHAVGNLVLFLLQAGIGQLAAEGTAGDAGWTLLAADSVVLPLFAVAVVALHRRFGLTHRSPVPA